MSGLRPLFLQYCLRGKRGLLPLCRSILVVLGCGCLFPGYGQSALIREWEGRLPENRDSVGYTDLLNRIGGLIQGQYPDSAFYYGAAAQSIAVRQHDAGGRAAALDNIGMALYLKGWYGQALLSFDQARAAYEQAPDHSAAALVLMHAARVYVAMGDAGHAGEFCRKSLLMAGGTAAADAVSQDTGGRDAGNREKDSILCRVYAGYAVLCPGLGEDSVRYWLQRAELTAAKRGDEGALFGIRQMQAGRLLGQKKAEQALPYILQALEIARRGHWESRAMEGLGLYGSYCLARNNIDSAIQCYDSAYGLAMANGYGEPAGRILSDLLGCYEIKNDEQGELRLNRQLVRMQEQQKAADQQFTDDYLRYVAAQAPVARAEVTPVRDGGQGGTLTLLSLVLVALLMILLVVLWRYHKRAAGQLTDKARLQETIDTQKELLRQSDGFKTELLRLLTHEFQSPMHSVLSLTNMLDNDMLEKEDLPRLHRSMEMEIQHVMLGFDNILVWLKKQLYGYVFHTEFLTVRELMEESIAGFGEQAATKQIRFRNEVSPTLVLHSDKEAVQFINRNLIHNALKFSPVGGTITLCAKRDKEDIIVAIKDEGDNHTGVDKMAGIAITIAREFIRQLGGRAWIERQNEGREGRGGVFYYALPL